MNCEKCDCKLEADEQADITKLIAMSKQPPQICTECLMQLIEEPAKTEWDSEVYKPN